MLFRSDKFRSFSSRNLFRGAAVLTAAGLITRIMGFFFRIFLSHAFRRRKRRFISAHFPVLCTLSVSQHIRDSNRRLTHRRQKKMSSVVTYSAASSSSPHIERQKEDRKHSCSFSWLHTLSLTYRIIFSPKKRLLYSNNFFRRCQV